ncbi:MAG: dihydroxy-acid dehydratase [Opitutae bacterium]|jgi:dihydroxy-acid dehydratase|nr:dihydroxy-acid dehydratase [Opitutae bacterium]MBT5717417.1 dihydroxy-acid dehydratase [Opitutae bacterium]
MNSNWNSKKLTHGWQKGVNAFYYGLGLDDKDLNRPQVGIGTPLLEGNLCNIHAYELARKIVEGCENAGLLGFPFGTLGVSDNISQGHEGGNASLPSRNLIANSAECVVTAHGYDALVGLHHCDKNGPGFAMALARTNYPGLIISGGSIKPGCHAGKDITILDVYDSQASARVGDISEDDANQILRKACPGAGGCGIAASFNTWGIAMEAIGLMPPYSSSTPAEAEEKRNECLAVAKLINGMLASGLRPRDILTRNAFENATVAIAAAGGSTNGILHLLALAQEADVAFDLSDIQSILRSTPVLANFAPRGKGTMLDLHNMGGTPAFLKILLDGGLLDGDCVTITGKTIAENLTAVTRIPSDSDFIRDINNPFKEHADMQVCFGNIAPGGVVFKVSSLKETIFRGIAICFDDAIEIVKAVEAKRIKPGMFVILRYHGPVACGMPEVLVATSALSIPELDGKVAFLSDTRVSGVSHGAIGVHCSPEAAVGGPIALVENGDEIFIDLLAGHISWSVSEAEIVNRRQKWISEKPNFERRGYLADFTATVAQANFGCVSKAHYPDCT